jgi:hypothetical protein
MRAAQSGHLTNARWTRQAKFLSSFCFAKAADMIVSMLVNYLQYGVIV